MKRIIAYIRRKLSVRVSLWVVFFAAIIFYATIGFLFYQARDAVSQEAVNRATQILEKTSLQVEGILNRVEVASNMTKWLVMRHPEHADSMFVYSRGMLENNPDFYNCSIAFEPYYFKDKGRYFSAYTMHVGDSIRTIQCGSDEYQYFLTDWYLRPKQQDKPCWTEPYIDHDVPTNTNEMVTSYGQPLKDEQGSCTPNASSGSPEFFPQQHNGRCPFRGHRQDVVKETGLRALPLPHRPDGQREQQFRHSYRLADPHACLWSWRLPLQRLHAYRLADEHHNPRRQHLHCQHSLSANTAALKTLV